MQARPICVFGFVRVILENIEWMWCWLADDCLFKISEIVEDGEVDRKHERRL